MGLGSRSRAPAQRLTVPGPATRPQPRPPWGGQPTAPPAAPSPLAQAAKAPRLGPGTLPVPWLQHRLHNWSWHQPSPGKPGGRRWLCWDPPSPLSAVLEEGLMVGGEESHPFPCLLQGWSPPPHSHYCAAAPSPFLPTPQTQTGQCWDETGGAISSSALIGLGGGLGRDPSLLRGCILPRCPSTAALGLGAACPVPPHGMALPWAPHQWEPVRIWRDTGRPMELVGSQLQHPRKHSPLLQDTFPIPLSEATGPNWAAPFAQRSRQCWHPREQGVAASPAAPTSFTPAGASPTRNVGAGGCCLRARPRWNEPSGKLWQLLPGRSDMARARFPPAQQPRSPPRRVPARRGAAVQPSCLGT